MKVHIHEAVTVKLNPLSSRTYHPGTYEISDPKILEQLEGKAEPALPEKVEDLKPAQVAALAHVADGVLMEAANQARQILLAADLDEMKVDELRQLAAACGLAHEPKAKKAEIVAALAAAREALQAAG